LLPDLSSAGDNTKFINAILGKYEEDIGRDLAKLLG
jgi:hypothetical protein